jgi:uncharacterized tellurite resistance protein B-like protein
MANWKNLLSTVLLADGVIDAAETKILKKEIFADGVVDNEEVDFLVGLRNAAKKTSPEFDKFFFAALKMNLLEDEVIDAAEVKKLREILYADGVIDANEKKFMKDLKKSAKKVAPAFDELLEDCLK